MLRCVALLCLLGLAAEVSATRLSLKTFLRVQIEMAGRDTTLCWEPGGREKVRRGWRVEECSDLGQSCRQNAGGLCECIQVSVLH